MCQIPHKSFLSRTQVYIWWYMTTNQKQSNSISYCIPSHTHTHTESVQHNELSLQHLALSCAHGCVGPRARPDLQEWEREVTGMGMVLRLRQRSPQRFNRQVMRTPSQYLQPWRLNDLHATSHCLSLPPSHQFFLACPFFLLFTSCFLDWARFCALFVVLPCSVDLFDTEK